MQLMDMDMTDKGQTDAGRKGTDREDKHRKGAVWMDKGHKGADSTEQGCERRCGTGDCAES
jgi:hypothetical protein